MSTVEAPPRRDVAAAPHPTPGTRGTRRGAVAGRGLSAPPAWVWVVPLLAGALALRLWGLDHGLPYAYNTDENSHFVPHAIGIFGHAWNPEYFVNPPAYTYVLHVVFAVVFGGREGLSSTFAGDPAAVWVVARAVTAVLGTLAVGLLYLAGSRLMDRRVGLLAAGLMAVAFLPVFYAHLALNDVPTLAPLCLGLWGVAGVLRFGRTRDWVVAGAGLGLAAATKYTGGIVLLPLLAAAAVQLTAPGRRAPVLRGLALAAGVGLAAFVVANPYAVLDFETWFADVVYQTETSSEAAGKLGTTQDSGFLYYLWSFGWGLGWVPLALAAAGAVAIWFDDRRLGLVLVLAPVAYVVFMGSQERYFGRWLLPAFPMVCLLAAYAALRVVDALTVRRAHLRPTLLALAVVAVCGQGLVYSLHSGTVLSREDTRNMARDWMVANVPVGARIVVEPVVPDPWAMDIGDPSPVTANGYRWNKDPVSRSYVDPETGERLDPQGPGVVVNIEDYARVARPELIDRWERTGACIVVVGSTQRGRAEVEPEKVPNALRFYDELERRAEVAYEASPYAAGVSPVTFNFDWAFNFYPLAYYRPGPVMTIYRLQGGACAG
ncbi:MAG TPA: glycosyltransferase family 39 protein [Solirubrobacteraceae bacterium]|nr:glycosyltransferase family 39 protein [Solirubrobacteraceae bacterium]